jgi:hypothetical protein
VGRFSQLRTEAVAQTPRSVGFDRFDTKRAHVPRERLLLGIGQRIDIADLVSLGHAIDSST